MANYTISLRSGKTITIEDERALGVLATQLAHEGFVLVKRHQGGYSQGTTEVALMERAVESIEVVE